MIRVNFISRLGLFKKYLDLKTKAENIFCEKKRAPVKPKVGGTEFMTFW